MKDRAGLGLGQIDSTTPVLIFGLSRGAFHHGALGIARSAGRLGIEVYRISRERWVPAAFSRYSSGWCALPKKASERDVLDILHEHRQRIGRAILVPIDDAASVFVDEHSPQLREDYLFPFQPAGLPETLSSKREMYELCREYNIPTAASAFPESQAELLAEAERMSFPIVLKVIKAGSAPPEAPRVAIVASRDELLEKHSAMESGDEANVMLQEYIPGTPESVWMFNGYFDGGSECRMGLTGKKIRQAPPYTGITTLGVCAPNVPVEQATVRLMKAVGYRGILDIGYRFDERDGEYKLLDVNPRIGGTFRLFVATNGMDVLRALYLDLTGQRVPATSARVGRRWVVQPMDLASSVVYRWRGDLTVRSWLRSFKGVREEAWFAADDPLPFAVLWLLLLIDWLPRRLIRRRPAKPTEREKELTAGAS
jgi:predicted ATP-grasp superfamily ATP-dependent carboligase